MTHILYMSFFTGEFLEFTICTSSILLLYRLDDQPYTIRMGNFTIFFFRYDLFLLGFLVFHVNLRSNFQFCHIISILANVILWNYILEIDSFIITTFISRIWICFLFIENIYILFILRDRGSLYGFVRPL